MAAVSYLLQVAAVLILFQASSGQAASTCPDGYYCPIGESVPRPCPDGHSCPDPRTRPIPCPSGSASRNAYINHRLTCAECSDGFYQDKPGQRDCLPCPDGHKCPAPKTRPIPCPPGSASRNVYINHRLTCAECSDGYYQDKPGQSVCFQCPQGRYCPQPKNRAIPCPAGMVSRANVGDRVNCVACSNGKYQSKTGQSACLICPEGHECPSPKNLSIPCPPGFANSYSRYLSDRVNCLACGAGYYQNKAGQSRCILCPNGYYCPQKENGPIACPSGFTSASYVSQKISCVECSRGQCLAAVPPPVVCQAGTFLDTGTGSCKSCQAGQYQIHPGQTSCQICPEGFYCPTTTEKPIPCPIGTYSTEEMGVRTACLACSIGTYQLAPGQKFCLVCPAGYICNKPNLYPVPCPAGTHASYDTTDRTKCLPCSDREYQDQRGRQNCKRCPAGYFCPRADLSPQQCPPNTYSTYDFTNRGRCLHCPTGQYQDQCGQAQCKNVFADGTSPPLGPSLTCPSLNTSEVVADSLCGEQDSRSAYSGALVRLAEGNYGVLYPVVKILQDHLPARRKVIDNDILLSTALAFDKMATAAKTESVAIAIISGFRTYERQEYLYNCSMTIECNGSNLTAVPGTSRHGTGIALDLNTNCSRQSGNQPPPECAASAVYTWLKNNAHRFGFVRTVKEEPWHWEFQGGPVARRSRFT